MAAKIGGMVMGPVATNCYYIYNEETGKALVFDPPVAGEKIYERLTDKGLTICAILITHGHF
ncbi:MAG: MBL fold metallo-hydrolase, partial [Lachnospiraceae bacterium]|nr:MBL fold metallo-hydrolase [Lachnospiraceae bacterium]